MGKTKTKLIDDSKVEEVSKVAEEPNESNESKETEEPKAAQKATKHKPSKKVRSKKYREALEKVDPGKLYPINEAIEAVKQASYAKFGGSIEAHITTNVKNLRGLVTLPFTSGKKLKILVFGKGAAESGADIVGDEEKLKQLEKGKFDFDVLAATPEWMPRLARLAKVLGPRGLMPNPKNGTISDNLKKAVTELQSGKTEYKTEKDKPVMHLRVGALNQDSNEVYQNLKVLFTTLGKSRVKKVVLAPTMGPGVKVDASSVF